MASTESPTAPVIEFEGVTKQYGAITALENVSFEVPPGSVFALSGENGAGKTTAIRTMLGLERPSSGSTRVLGLDSRRSGTDIRRRFGYVAEQPALYDWMTVGEIGWFSAGFYPDGYSGNYSQLID